MDATAFQRRRREIIKNQEVKETKEGVKDDNNTRQSKSRPATKRNK